ncbi:Formyl transferase [Thiohalorhabdus denitrificans]|uniref:Formyl transferase n=1 Tax=Thiohalorhabdus denitrificans TaxID=381306 RepID=A0A1G5HA04_9GAMM|nr:Formyl transferase [Thiohalorhabdus denitrificans]
MVGIAEKSGWPEERPGKWRRSWPGPPGDPGWLASGPRVAIGGASEQEQLAGLVGRLQPDMAVVSRWSLLSADLIRAFPQGVLNTHLSLLPELRGKHPAVGALLAGLRRTGVTIQVMQEGIDTGPILLQRPFPIEVGDGEGEITARAASLLAPMYRQVIEGMRTGCWPKGRQQSTGMECHFSWKRQFGSEPPERLPVDWSAPAWLIHRVARLRVCCTRLGGREVTLRWTGADEAVPEGCLSETPGEVLSVQGRRIRVMTGQGVAELEVAGPVGDLGPGVHFENGRWPRWREFVAWVEALPREVKLGGATCQA